MREALPAGLRGEFDDFRVGCRVIIRRHRVGELTQLELQPTPGVRLQVGEVAEFEEKLRVQLVGLLQVLEEGQLPFRSREPGVSLRCWNCAAAPGWRGQLPPQREVVAIERFFEGAQFCELPGVGGREYAHKGRNVRRARGRGQIAEEFFNHAGAGAIDFLQHVARGLGGRGHWPSKVLARGSNEAVRILDCPFA